MDVCVTLTSEVIYNWSWAMPDVMCRDESSMSGIGSRM